MSDNIEFTKSILRTDLEIAREEHADHIIKLLEHSEVSFEQTHYDNWNNGTYSGLFPTTKSLIISSIFYSAFLYAW